MYVAERRSEIVNLIQKNGSANVNELARAFSTSKETIRRDLSQLTEMGIISRTHGGAVLYDSGAAKAHASNETPVMLRNIQNVTEKQAICQKAAEMVNAGDTIFIDNSSTCINLYRYLPREMPLTIITNSISFLVECSKIANSRHTIICLGGLFKTTNLSVYGNSTILNAKQYYPDKTFISCSGINNKFQITDSGVQEIDLKRTLIESSQSIYLLADHTKFLHTGPVFLCGCSDIDYLITDDKVTEDSLHFLTYTDMKIIVTTG